MENGIVLLCLIFNIHPVVSSAVFALVMDIVAVDRPILCHPVAAAQAPEIGVIIVRCHHTRPMALGAFYLDAGGEGAVGTVGEIGFIDNSAHAPTHSFRVITFTAETGMGSNLSQFRNLIQPESINFRGAVKCL